MEGRENEASCKKKNNNKFCLQTPMKSKNPTTSISFHELYYSHVFQHFHTPLYLQIKKFAHKRKFV